MSASSKHPVLTITSNAPQRSFTSSRLEASGSASLLYFAYLVKAKLREVALHRDSGASMAEPEALTPASSHDDHNDGTEDGHSKPHAAKDRECQFCHQKFTSSSLGRHLDQYLHKKKPDGVHNVDEIRRLRGGITRRTARNSSKNEHDESRTSNASPAPTLESPAGPVVDTLNIQPVNGLGTKFNSMNWHSTGVINNLKDIPAMPTTLASPVGTPLSTKRNYSTFAGMDQPTTRSSGVDNEKDNTIRALELSLREVLDSVHAATARAAPRPSPFTFDLQKQTFPSLVLQLLPTPPTLFSASPFATSTSAPLEPPDSSHLTLLRLNLETKIQTWKWTALRHAQSQTFPTAHSHNLGEEADYLTHTALQYEDFARKHLDTSFQAWNLLTPEEKRSTWSLELMRAFRTQAQKVTDLEDRLETLTSEANRLQGQVEHLSRCQWPREMALWPPEPVKFTKLAAEEIRTINLDSPSGNKDTGRNGGGSRDALSTKEITERWDYDRLVGKWRRRVREDRTRRTGTGMVAAAATATATPTINTPGSRLIELQREESSATPPLLNGNGGGNSGPAANAEQRRKSTRQSQQQQQLVTSHADQDDHTRELRLGLEAMNNR
jgi:hypothetical protein